MKIIFALVVTAIFANADSVLYKAAAVHTVDRGIIKPGQMLVTDGRIAAVGKRAVGKGAREEIPREETECAGAVSGAVSGADSPRRLRWLAPRRS